MVAMYLVFYFFYQGVAKPYSIASKTLRFNYTMTNTSGEFIPHADFSIKIPKSIDAIQRVISIGSSHKNKLVQEDGGEQSVYFSMDNISLILQK